MIHVPLRYTSMLMVISKRHTNYNDVCIYNLPQCCARFSGIQAFQEEFLRKEYRSMQYKRLIFCHCMTLLSIHNSCMHTQMSWPPHGLSMILLTYSKVVQVKFDARKQVKDICFIVACENRRIFHLLLVLPKCSLAYVIISKLHAQVPAIK